MKNLFFLVSDLHGSLSRYEKLFKLIGERKPSVVLIAGDILPGGFNTSFDSDFFDDFLVPALKSLKKQLKTEYPLIGVILGNDDPKITESRVLEVEDMGLWKYIHNKYVQYHDYKIFGYSFVPPTPFLLKDWEKYDVSRFVDPGCIPPTEGYRSTKENKDEMEFSTIAKDLELLTKDENLDKSIFVFHSPPHKTKLDRAALDGKYIDHVPLDVHVGSIAIKRFIEEKQPYLTIHGHVHESTNITGEYKDLTGKTMMLNPATNSDNLSLISLDINDLNSVKRELL